MDNKLLIILLAVIFLSIIFFGIKSKIDAKKQAHEEEEEQRKEQARIKKMERNQSGYNANMNRGVVSAKKSSIMDKKDNDLRKKPTSWTSTSSYEEDIEKTTVVKEITHITLPTQETHDNELKVKILLVDDSLVVRKYVGTLLTKSGYEVILKTDGLEALNFLENENRPDIIISDIEMPNMDGIELISKLRTMENFTEMPILVISAHAENHLQLIGSQSIQGFIKKPFKDEDLLMQIEYVLENNY